MLEIEGLVTRFAGPNGTVHAVNGVSFNVDRGEIVGLVGESGSGKSVTVRSIMGLVEPPGQIVHGSIRLAGRELVGMKRRELRRIRGVEMGFVGQSPFASLNPILSIEAQFRNVVRAHRRASAAEARSLATEKLAAVRMPGIDRVLKGYAHELSGGMAQRVVIALAMLLDPPLLIADEPTTALDVTVQREILELLRELMSAGGRSMLIVTHDLGVVAQYCRRVVVMYAGKVVEQGPVAAVFGAPAHPYTQALLDAVPRPGRPLVGLQGAPPDLVRYPVGCPYAARCSRTIARCRIEAPVPEPVGDRREASCFVPAGEKAIHAASAG
jgi:oligopeptide/dipeptide ABC transporter ATP-binding protein